MEMKIRDLYEGAYLLCMGFRLKQLTIIDGHGKPKALFVIVGDGIEEKAESYRTGRATVNVAMLKFTLEKLKDEMFARIREQGASTRSNGLAGATAGNVVSSTRAYGEQEKEKRGRNERPQQAVSDYQTQQAV